jgi:Glycosyl hydrolases family 39
MRRRKILKMAISTTVSTVLLDSYFQQNSKAQLVGDKKTIYISQNVNSMTTQISIDWSKIVAESTPLTFGSNDFQVTNISSAQDSAYRSQIAQIGFGLIRIHNAYMINSWTDAISRTWDVTKIKAVYDAYSSTTATIIQNIPGWPIWMRLDEKGLLHPSEYNNYAAFCATLVDIINNRLGHQVIYWEPLNEKDIAYKNADRIDELWKIYNLVAQAMKARNQRIKIGGPALTWDEPIRLGSFLRACEPNIDFISWHRYATGDANISTATLMSLTSRYGEQVRNLRRVAVQNIPNRHIPLLLGEYNINYSWRSGENRQNTHIGAVWFASVLKHLAEAGIDMATSWNLKDGIYGLIDQRNQPRLAGTVFAWAIKYLTGSVMATNSNNSSVEAMAVQQRNGKRSLLLINKSDSFANLTLRGMNSINFAGSIPVFYLNANGVRNSTIDEALLLDKSLSLPPYSLALLLM